MTINRIKELSTACAAASVLLLAGCERAADVASYNISQASDNFEINRRIVFYNGITDSYMLVIEGLCSLDLKDLQVVRVTCKTGPQSFKKHYLGLSDNVTYFAEQVEAASVSAYHYKVLLRPQTIVPDVGLDVRGLSR